MPEAPALLIVLALDALLCATALAALRTGKMREGQGAWCAALLCAAAGFASLASGNPRLDAFGPVWLAASGSCYLLSMHRIARSRLPPALLLAPPLAVWLAWALPLTASARALGIAGILAATVAACALPLLRHPADIAWIPRKIVSAGFALSALAILAGHRHAHALGTQLGAHAAFVGINLSIAILHCERMRRETERLAARDPVTGLFNRRSFVTQAGRELLRARRGDTPLAALMIDIDGFKLINERQGHLAGDRVLQHFAALLQNTLRVQDLCGRHDRDRFCALLSDTTLDGARQFVQRLREALAHTRVAPDDVAYTVSIGIATLEAGESSPLPLLSRAQDALYAAKSSGGPGIASSATPTP